MGTRKLTLNFESVFIFLFLAVFPLGQIIRIGMLQPVDLIAGMGALFAIFKKYQKPEVFKYFETFLIVAGFSWVFSIFIFKQADVFYGLLYLIRLVAYIYFLIYVWNLAKKSEINKKLLTDSLLAVSVFSAMFGWIQYFTYSNINPFMIWGWDMHLFRLVGTFLDPTFLGLIIVFGLLVAINKFLSVKTGGLLITMLFLLVSLAFTYSRGSYLAFFAGIAVIAYYKKIFRKIILVVLGFLLLMLILPTSQNHVLSFTRSFSAFARIENYQTTLSLFAKSPVFGVGYDNLCIAYQKFVGYQSFASHACSGSDSSLLFILATTGIVGVAVFINLLLSVWKYIFNTKYSILFISSFAALFMHSLFSNSLVYPWVLGWIIILLGVSLRGKIQS